MIRITKHGSFIILDFETGEQVEVNRQADGKVTVTVTRDEDEGIEFTDYEDEPNTLDEGDHPCYRQEVSDIPYKLTI